MKIGVKSIGGLPIKEVNEDNTGFKCFAGLYREKKPL